MYASFSELFYSTKIGYDFRLGSKRYYQGESYLVSLFTLGLMLTTILTPIILAGKVSMDHFIKENNCNPERILLFRDGISDGNFSIAQAEIESVRQASEESIGCRIPISE